MESWHLQVSGALRGAVTFYILVRWYDVTGFFYWDMGCNDKEGCHWLLGEDIGDKI